MRRFTIIMCSYNTPKVTTRCLKSFINIHKRVPYQILLFENSTDEETVKLLNDEDVPFIRTEGKTHGHAVNDALNLCETEYALLIDSDVIFTKSVEGYINQAIELGAVLAGRIEGDRGGKKIRKRVHPWFCLINVRKLREHNIKFTDFERMEKNPTLESIYDVGSSMFEDCRKHKLPIAHIDIENKCFKHWEGMSWYTNKYNGDKEDTNIDIGGTHNNTPLYLHGLEKEKQFEKETLYLDSVDLKEQYTKNVTNQVYIICHDIDIIKYLKQQPALNGAKYILVGKHDVVSNNDCIVACKQKDNIEDNKEFLQFTAWYALVRNNLITTDYVTLIEYDTHIFDNFSKDLEYNIREHNCPIFGFASLPVNNSFLNRDIFSKELCNYLDTTHIKTNEILTRGKDWIVTSNVCIKSRVLQQYVTSYMFNDCLKLFKGDKMAGHYFERLLSVYMINNMYDYKILPDVLVHYAIDSHGTQGITQSFDKLKALYEN